MKVLMVCIGNICRSPIAEGVFQHYIDRYHLNWEVNSAAVKAYHLGAAPHKLSQKICHENGIDITNQRASLFQITDFETYDVIYAMAHDVMDHIHNMAVNEEQKNKVKLFLNEHHTLQNQSVPDPWYGPDEMYLTVFGIIDQTCQQIINKNK